MGMRKTTQLVSPGCPRQGVIDEKKSQQSHKTQKKKDAVARDDVIAAMTHILLRHIN
jgi:hypothetical protein